MCKACENRGIQSTKFVNLHVHSCYSLLDGMSKLEDIVSKVKKMGQHSFAITEHGNLFSAVKAYKLAKEHSLKHIYGIEFYITRDRFTKDPESKYNHLTVLAKNEAGRKNINKLSSLGYIEGFYYKPRIDHELLKEHKEGLIVLSGCMASEFQQALSGGKIGDTVTITEANISEAKRIAKKYRNIFGEDYYLEIQSHSDMRQQQLNRAIVDIANDLNIPYVVTADSHFVDKEDFELHGIFIQIGTNREAGETYADGQLQCEREARDLLKPLLTDDEIEIAVRNTSVIADKCNVHVPISAPIIPHVKVPPNFESEKSYLKHLCNEGWKRRKINGKPNRKEYMDRLMFEYNAIIEMGFEGYYLLVESYANSVKRRGIARGSGGGSLVAFLLNIVDIDPIEYGLYFERFIDVGALDLLKNGTITRSELKVPDFDLDFGRFDREIVIQSIINQHGEDNFVALGQFGYIWDKTAIKDVGKVLGVDFDITNAITKELDVDTIDEILREGRMKKYTEQYPKLFEYARKLAGLPKSFGVHPCGRAITTSIATDYLGVAKNDDTIILQGDMHDAESLGIVKIDALGLRTVDVIYDTLEMIGKDYEYIAPQNMNFNDEQVLELFRQGNTEGMFQFESSGMRQTLKKMKPTGLDDLGVANALFRPGSMKFIDDYVKRKNGEEAVVYTHPDLEPILKVTYGIIVFQEQLIEIGRFANMRNPDLLRQATGKKDIKKLNKAKPELVYGLKAKGWNDEQIENLWDIMLDFAKYSFNKSHSYAYAMIAYITAFLKTYHPKEFICALFNSYIGTNTQDKFEHIKGIFEEAGRIGIQVSLPTLEEARHECCISGDNVIYGLELIKSVNKQVAEELRKLSSNKYYSFTQFLIDVVESTAIQMGQMQTLIKIDLFHQFGERENLLELFLVMTGKKKANFEKYPEFSDKEVTVRTEKTHKRTGKVTVKEELKIVKKPLAYGKEHVEKTKIERTQNLLDYEKMLSERPPAKIDLFELVSFEKEIMGFALTKKDVHKSYALVVDIDKKYKPKITLYQIATGKEFALKMEKKKFFTEFDDDLLYIGDIIKVVDIENHPAWKMVDGKWMKNHEKPPEPHLEKLSFVRKSPLREVESP